MPVAKTGVVPAYEAFKKSSFAADRKLYTKIGETTSRELIQSFTLSIRSGHAWTVPKGNVCRIITPEGPQVGDLNIWNRAQSARKILGLKNEAASRFSCLEIRPAVVMSPISETTSHYYW